MTTEAVRTKSPTLELGRSFRSFVRSVGLVPEGGKVSGGKRGVGTMAQRQTLALLKAIVSWCYHERNRDRGKNNLVAEECIEAHSTALAARSSAVAFGASDGARPL